MTDFDTAVQWDDARIFLAVARSGQILAEGQGDPVKEAVRRIVDFVDNALVSR